MDEVTRLRTNRRLAIVGAVVLGLVAAAVPFLTLVNFDPNVGLPQLQPAPSAAVQKRILAEFAAYPLMPLSFTSLIHRGAEAQGLATLLSKMRLSENVGRRKVYEYVLTAKPEPRSDSGVIEVMACIHIDGSPGRVVSTSIYDP